MPEVEQVEAAHAVSIKMPTFMETAADAWFSILEANFHIKKITVEQTKYFHLISVLPPDIVSKIPASRRTDQNYTNIKEDVIAIYERSKPELFSKLINKTTMSGRPSLYLQELSTIATKVGVGDDLVRHQFLQALPSTISPAVASQQDASLGQLGKLADELMPLCNATNTEKQVFQVTQVEKQKSYPNNQKLNNNGIPIGIRPFNDKQRPKICRGHLYYAEKSRTCKPWCKYPGNKSMLAMQPNSRSSSPNRSQGN